MEKLRADEVFAEKSSFWDFQNKYEFVDQWTLMSSPVPLLALTAAYLLFVLKLGPDYMKNRRPYDLRNVLLIYNAIQVVVSSIMVYLCLRDTLRVGLVPTTCMTDTYEEKHHLATMIYYYFSCKISELLDTVFFVLRKKQNQVTFLHVYHHTLMVWNGWVFLKYEPGWWMLFLGTLNCFVHVVMYAYYGLSAYPNLQKYLWWKKYITSLQLTQFVLVLIQLTMSILTSECKPSRLTIVYFYTNGFLFIYLFSNFYKKAYSKDNEVQNGANNTNENGITYRNGKETSFGTKIDVTNGVKTHKNGKDRESEIKTGRRVIRNRN